MSLLPICQKPEYHSFFSYVGAAQSHLLPASMHCSASHETERDLPLTPATSNLHYNPANWQGMAAPHRQTLLRQSQQLQSSKLHGHSLNPMRHVSYAYYSTSTERKKYVEKRQCAHDGCFIKPAYNIKGQSKGLFCSKHKLSVMVNVTVRQCEDEGCKLRAIFNETGAILPRFCASHKKPGMINIMSKRCESVGCDVIASYGDEGRARRQFCVAHKEHGMVLKTGTQRN